jgi:uncharacterized membrane protein
MERALLALHLMLIALGTGMSFSNLVNLRLARALGPEAGQGLAQQRRMIARIGDGVIALIWLTGLVLLWVAPVLWAGWLSVKLAFAVLLTLCHGLARRTAGVIARTGNAGLISRLQGFIAGAFVSALAAILFAVLAFES